MLRGRAKITLWFVPNRGGHCRNKFIKPKDIFIVDKCGNLTALIIDNHELEMGLITPCNAVSNRPYSGCNIVLLWMAQAAGYRAPRFLTFKQALELGGHIRKGERGTKVYFVNRFGSRNYGAEELIAELGAAFLCAEFGFDGDLRHAGYIANWIELLKADKRAFFTACSQASKAADYLRGLALAAPAEVAA